jgi:hypothetical protein
MHALEGLMKRLLIAAAATVSANQSLPDQARTVSELNKRLAFGRRWSGPREGRRLVPAKAFVLKDNEISGDACDSGSCIVRRSGSRGSTKL